MRRRGFAWEREEERFAEKRSAASGALLGTRLGLLLMGISVGLLLILFVITPILLFRGALDYLFVIVVILVYLGVAVVGERLLGIKDGADGRRDREP